MALKELWTDNAATALAAPISSIATSLSVTSGTGAAFPVVIPGTNFFRLVLTPQGAPNSVIEIVYVTARSVDTFTISRGQEGTNAQSWSSGSIVQLSVTAGSLASLAPLDSPAFTGVPTAPNPATGTRSTQIATMQKFADEFPCSLSAQGWAKFPNDWILQWGYVLTNSSGQAVITFPIEFPHDLLRMVIQPFSGITAGYVVGIQISQTPTGAVINVVNSSNFNLAPAGIIVGYHAVGW